MVKPTKKILFFIVEGSTDKTALEKFSKKFIEKNMYVLYLQMAISQVMMKSQKIMSAIFYTQK